MNRLNSMAGKDYIKISPETFFVLETARKYSELSKGKFDITIGPLVKAWAIGTDNARIPEQKEVDSLLPLVSYNDIVLNKSTLKAGLARKNQIADLGGIAKGYAGDEAVKILKKNGISSAFINIGGNVVTFGKKPDGSLWKIAIQNPRSGDGNFIGILNVASKAIVTSGDYERYFIKNGVRYHHILDPSTGYPAESDLIAVTVVYDKSVDADALSTSLFILGMKRGYELIKTINGAEAVFITQKHEIYITKALKNIFTFKDVTEIFSYRGIINDN